jgi:hypothetical protein
MCGHDEFMFKRLMVSCNVENCDIVVYDTLLVLRWCLLQVVNTTIVRFLFLKKTCDPGFDLFKRNWRFFKCEFEPNSSHFKTLQFQFWHIFSTPRTSRPSFDIGPIPCKHDTFFYCIYKIFYIKLKLRSI